MSRDWVKADGPCIVYLFDASFNFKFMILAIRPFICPFISIVKQGGKHRFPNLERLCHWDKDRSWTKLSFSKFVCLKNAILELECWEDMCLVKNGSNMYLGDDGAKELVIICDHVHFSRKNEWTHDCFQSP